MRNQAFRRLRRRILSSLDLCLTSMHTLLSLRRQPAKQVEYILSDRFHTLETSRISHFCHAFPGIAGLFVGRAPRQQSNLLYNYLIIK